MPSWGSKAPAVSEVEPAKTPEPEVLMPVQTAETPAPAPEAQKEEFPQGSEAAELAAASRPRRQSSEQMSHLPAPLVGASPISPLEMSAATGIPLLPQPEPLGAPLVSAGVILPGERAASPEKAEESVWNMLDLKSLPIPGLGSAQAANAAALDMPVPSAPRQASPFTPAEQLSGGRAANIPLQPRQSPYPDDGFSPQPVNPDRTVTAPAPAITGRQPMHSVQTQAQELARQQQDLLLLREQMDQRLKDLQSAEDKMKDMLQQAKDAEETKVKSLVMMYANMKPKMAAQALENMDERTAVRILQGLTPKQSGEILTYTNPTKTAKFTEMFSRMKTLH